MLIIAHRGNTNGPNPSLENKPSYIDEALQNKGIDVEIDLRIKDNQLYLGHDEPTYLIDQQFIIDRQDHLWIHCKDIESLIYCSTHLPFTNYFWHQEDDYTLTSKGFIWVYPCQPIPPNKTRCICVIPEVDRTFVNNSYGVCSDYKDWESTTFDHLDLEKKLRIAMEQSGM
jgi:hypothetical protein